MNGMLIIIEKDGVELEVRRIEEETAAACFLSHWQMNEDMWLDRLSFETILLMLNQIINDTRKYIDNFTYPHYRIVSQNLREYHAAFTEKNRKDLNEYENLRELFEFLYDILLNNSNVKVRMKKIVCEKEN